MKQGTVIFILLVLLGLMVQAAGAEDVEMNGSVKADSFSGNGSKLTGIDAVNITTGSISSNRIENFSILPSKMAFYGKVAIVATSGGDYNNPAAAMSDSAVAAWCGTPSTDNRCLLKIMPGVYNLGTCDTSGTPPFSCVLYMKEYIDIEGSGENTTKITGAIGTEAAPPTAGLIVGADNAELRFLTAENAGTGTRNPAILNSSSSPSIQHVTVITSGAGTMNSGVYNVTSSPIMNSVTLDVSGGNNSNNGIVNSDSSSPKINNLSITSSGGQTCRGVYNMASSSPIINNVNLTVSGGTSNNYGIHNDASSATLNNITATVSDGTTNTCGVYNVNSTVTMTNVILTASGGNANVGLKTSTGGTIRVNHSVISGSNAAINNAGGATIYIGNTQLEGGAVSGAVTCVGAYDGSYAALGPDCLSTP
jgi:hypothetical protein